MEPSDAPSTAPATSSPTRLTIQHGVDMLWRHQLRKESAALLERLDASRKMIEDATSETTRKLQDAAERISTLETKLSTIDNEGKRMREAKQKWDDDVAALKARMGIRSESYVPETQAISEPQRSMYIETPRPVYDTAPSSSSTPLTTTRMGRTAVSNVISDDDLPATRGLSPDATVPMIESQATASTNTTRTNTTRPRTRSRSKSKGPTPISDHPVDSPRVNPPRLIQGTNSLTTYYNNACTAFVSISKDGHSEIEFIGQFIKGIQDPKTRNKLVDVLQKAHPCRTGKDGKVEILCEWTDVAEGLNKAGLLTAQPVESAASEGAGRKKKKKKILIPRELIESGMMR